MFQKPRSGTGLFDGFVDRADLFSRLATESEDLASIKRKSQLVGLRDSFDDQREVNDNLRVIAGFLDAVRIAQHEIAPQRPAVVGPATGLHREGQVSEDRQALQIAATRFQQSPKQKPLVAFQCRRGLNDP